MYFLRKPAVIFAIVEIFSNDTSDISGTLDKEIESVPFPENLGA